MGESLKLGIVGALIGAELYGDGEVLITGVGPLEEAGVGDVTFIASPAHRTHLATTRASAVVVKTGTEPVEGKNLLFVSDPQTAFSVLLDKFMPAFEPEPGVHGAACVHPEAKVGQSVTIQANAVIERGAQICDRVVIYPGVYIGANAVVGADCILYPGVVIREGCVIGERVIIHPNAVVGSDGFGYTKQGAAYKKIPQRGIVVVGDDAEIGACVTTDRATMGETKIGRGTKIDNLVQIAHNVTIGEDAVIIAQVGVAGSTKIGDRVTIAGQAGLSGHIEICDDAIIGPQSGVIKDVKKKGVYTGTPAIPHMDWLRSSTLFPRLPEMRKTIKDLKQRIEELERQSSE